MARRKHRFIRIIAWIVGATAGLILLITLVFYLGRGWITRQVLDRFNEHHPGEVQLGGLNLIPLMDFPEAVIQFRDVSLYEKPQYTDSLYQEPVAYLHEFYVSLGIRELIRGEFQVSQLRLEEGFIRYELYGDSLSNLEVALGMRFAPDSTASSQNESMQRMIGLEEIRCKNLTLLYRDGAGEVEGHMKVKQLESAYFHRTDTLEGKLKLELDILKLKYQSYNIEDKKGLIFSGAFELDRNGQKLEVAPTLLEVAGLELETWGKVELGEKPYVNMAYRARNSGLEVLNTLFLGVFDLDEIRQTGAGNISLDGRISGELGKGIPEITVNGSAEGLGFRSLSLDREVRDIGFILYASSGHKEDFSEAQLDLSAFTADFSEGRIRGEVHAQNLVHPLLDLELEGNLDLAGLEQVIRIDSLNDLQGHLDMRCSLKGVVDQRSDDFLKEGSAVQLSFRDVGCVFGKDTLSGLTGELYMEDSILGSRRLDLSLNGSRARIDLHTENILHCFLGFDRPASARLDLHSGPLYPVRLGADTSLTTMVGGRVDDLDFGLTVKLGREDLDSLMKGALPSALELELSDFELQIPVYERISGLNASLKLQRDSLVLEKLEGKIGSSPFYLQALLGDLEALLRKDSASRLELKASLASERLRARDLGHYKGDFLLPEEYLEEELGDFYLDFALEMPLAAEGADSSLLSFSMELKELSGKLKNYPLKLDSLRAGLRVEENELHIDHFYGEAGGNNLQLQGFVGNYNDSIRENMYGNLEVKSQLIDLDVLTDYNQPESSRGVDEKDSLGSAEPLLLHALSYPDFTIDLDVDELRYASNTLFGIQGRLRTSREKIFFLEGMQISGSSGGSIGLSGEFDVSGEDSYVCKAQVELQEMNIRDIHMEMTSDEGSYTLEENFAGLVTGKGAADLFFTPSMELDLERTAANFTLNVSDGALKNFTPLKAAGKFLDNKDLNNVRFSSMYNSFTLKDGKVEIPLMTVQSTLGVILIEGEQGLDNSYLYLLRLPMWMIKDAAFSRLSKAEDDDQEDEIRQMQMGTVMMMTTWDMNGESGTKLGDRREKILK